jgi:8-oxo-dGTP diphosphatase
MARYIYCPMCATELVPRPDGLMKCPACRYTNYENPIPAAACLIPYDDGIVLVKRGAEPHKGEWCLPCGFLKKGEDFTSACIREIKEETGLDIEIEDLLYLCNPSTWGSPTNQVIAHYLGSVTNGVLRADDDATEIRIFTDETRPKLCFESHQKVVDEWFDLMEG